MQPRQRFHREIGPAAARNDCLNAASQLSSGDECGRRPRACAEKAKVQASGLLLLIEPPDGACKPFRKQRDVENIRAIGLFLRPEQVEQEGRHAPGVERVRDFNVTRA